MGLTRCGCYTEAAVTWLPQAGDKTDMKLILVLINCQPRQLPLMGDHNRK